MWIDPALVANVLISLAIVGVVGLAFAAKDGLARLRARSRPDRPRPAKR